MKNLNITKIYSILGKTLGAASGGIIAFMIGGPLLVVLGIVIGFLGTHLLEKCMVKPTAEAE